MALWKYYGTENINIKRLWIWRYDKHWSSVHSSWLWTQRSPQQTLHFTWSQHLRRWSPPQTPGTSVARPKLSVLLSLIPLSGLCLNWFAADSEEAVLSTSNGDRPHSGLRAPAGGPCLCCCGCFIEAELLVLCCFCVCLLRKYDMTAVNMIDPVMLTVCGCLYRALTLSARLLHILYWHHLYFLPELDLRMPCNWSDLFSSHPPLNEHGVIDLRS